MFMKPVEYYGHTHALSKKKETKDLKLTRSASTLTRQDLPFKASTTGKDMEVEERPQYGQPYVLVNYILIHTNIYICIGL